MSATEVMVDIETLGTDPNSVILSVGAVAFKGDDPKVDSFYQVLNIQDQINVGRQVSQSTLLWWMRQNQTARDAVFSHKLTRYNPAIFILEFIGWYEEIKPKAVWAKSPSFDLVMLEDMFRDFGCDAPWKFWDHRDVRTIVVEAGLDPVWKGHLPGFVGHHAGWDAHVQAIQVIEARHKIRDPR